MCASWAATAPTIPTARAGIPTTPPTAPIPTSKKRWDGQYPSLWVTNGGGGTFANLWSVDTYAQAGMLVSDTKTPGKVYEMSIEHHVRAEFALNRVENWAFYAPQTEEEAGESQEAVSFEISNSSNITLANWHAYRVTRNPRPVDTAMRLYNSVGHPFPQCACECRKRAWRPATPMAAAPICAPANSRWKMPSAT